MITFQAMQEQEWVQWRNLASTPRFKREERIAAWSWETIQQNKHCCELQMTTGADQDWRGGTWKRKSHRVTSDLGITSMRPDGASPGRFTLRRVPYVQETRRAPAIGGGRTVPDERPKEATNGA